jgi:hypothetical protein
MQNKLQNVGGAKVCVTGCKRSFKYMFICLAHVMARIGNTGVPTSPSTIYNILPIPVLDFT